MKDSLRTELQEAKKLHGHTTACWCVANNNERGPVFLNSFICILWGVAKKGYYSIQESNKHECKSKTPLTPTTREEQNRWVLLGDLSLLTPYSSVIGSVSHLVMLWRGPTDQSYHLEG